MKYRVIEMENIETGTKEYHIEHAILGFWIDAGYYSDISPEDSKTRFLENYGTTTKKILAEGRTN